MTPQHLFSLDFGSSVKSVAACRPFYMLLQLAILAAAYATQHTPRPRPYTQPQQIQIGQHTHTTRTLQTTNHAMRRTHTQDARLQQTTPETTPTPSRPHTDDALALHQALAERAAQADPFGDALAESLQICADALRLYGPERL